MLPCLAILIGDCRFHCNAELIDFTTCTAVANQSDGVVQSSSGCDSAFSGTTNRDRVGCNIHFTSHFNAFTRNEFKHVANHQIRGIKESHGRIGCGDSGTKFQSAWTCNAADHSKRGRFHRNTWQARDQRTTINEPVHGNCMNLITNLTCKILKKLNTVGEC